MKLVVAPQLVGEAVLTVVQHRPEAAGEYRARAEAIYGLSPSQREAAFAGLHGGLFQHWGLGQVPQQVTAEFSHLEPPVAALYLSAAAHPLEEEALLGRDGDKVGIKLCPSRFSEPALMEGILRHQLTHIADAVRHGFVAPAGRQGEMAIRERYLALWDAYIDGRLEAQGKSGEEPREVRLAQFQAAFPHLPSAAALARFQGIWGAREIAHATLLVWAEQPDRLGPAPPHGGPAPGARCPLCSFPTYEWAPPDRRLEGLLKADFPLWQPEHGLCTRCAELYQVRAGIW